MRGISFAENEMYHVYNRGVDKRIIFPESIDLDRFFDGMHLFNNKLSIGSLSRSPLRKNEGSNEKILRVEADEKLVKIIAYCLNPNHYHLILEQVAEKGIERFMHKLGMGHSKYINAKYKRSGALFQGSFKAIHIDTNEYLLHSSVYVNLNNKIHRYRHGVSVKSSWEEFVDHDVANFCDKNIILEQFKNKNEYKKFALEAFEDILNRKELLRELEDGEIINTL